jgi:pyruvate formate lyase activating enzyme
MEKQINGLVYDIRGFSVNDGPGIRKTVFLKGCPLRCAWCHNPESFECKPQYWERVTQTGSQVFSKKETLGLYYTADEVIAEIITDQPFFSQSGGGVTLSGGEPLVQATFSFEILKKCRQLNIHTCLDTSGFGPWSELEKISRVTDLVLYDLKLADNKLHKKFTGKGNGLILGNLKKLSRMDCEIHIRIPLVENITDTPDNLEAIKRIIADIPQLKRIDLLPYHNIARNKYRRMNLAYKLENMHEYSQEKAEAFRQDFSTLAAIVSIGG